MLCESAGQKVTIYICTYVCVWVYAHTLFRVLLQDGSSQNINIALYAVL